MIIPAKAATHAKTIIIPGKRYHRCLTFIVNYHDYETPFQW